MTIVQLLEMPIGQRTGGFLLTVKTAKKFWEVPNKDGVKVGHKGTGRILHQQAILTDETGEIIADIKILSPEHGNLCDAIKVGAIIRVVVCEIQIAYDKKGDTPEPNKKLFIDQFSAYIKEDAGRESVWGPEGAEALAWQEARQEEVKGKCRHGVVCALIQSPEYRLGHDKTLGPWEPNKIGKEFVNKVVDFIITGE